MNEEVDLSKYKIRTDLLIDEVDSLEEKVVDTVEEVIDDIVINSTKVLKDNAIRKKGMYTTISFNDITDRDNFKKVLDAFVRELQKIIDNLTLKPDFKTLVIGLGNQNSTPDSLGVKVCDNLIVTRHLFELDEASSNYRNLASFTPDVMGNTGIEAEDIISGLIDKIDVDLVIVVDALASSKIERVNKTIQLTDTGISPGSGVGNYRKEISPKTLKVPVIAIGVPTVVDSAIIVVDTIDLLVKKIEYLKNDDPKEKLKNREKINFLKEGGPKLSPKEKIDLLGMIGELSDEDLKSLIYDVLTPVGYNMMVTPKEIDFVIDKLALLIGKGINSVIHEIN